MRVVADTADARVVDQRVDTAVVGAHLRSHSRHSGTVGDVDLVGLRLRDLRCQFGCPLAVEVPNGDRRALACKLLAYLGTDSPGTPGHNRSAILKPCHARSFRPR